MNKITYFAFFFAILSLCSMGQASDVSWEDLQQSKEGEITIHFRINEPFLISNENNTLKGLEYEMMIGFKYFLLNRYGIKLDLKWKERENFAEIMNFIENDTLSGDIGLDIISRTEDREKLVSFSDPYFPDIQILISNRDVSTISSVEEFKEIFGNATAISVAKTTYDINLKSIKKEQGLEFEIKYINNSNEIIQTILETENSFGYVDLPSYLIALDNNLPVIRHNIFPYKGIGYCVIFPKTSDWYIPLNEYLTSSEFKLLQSKSIQKYLGYDVNNLISSISNGENEELVLLKQEKKFINKELTEKAKQVERESFVRNVLIVTIILAFMVAYFLFNRNRVKTTANEVLTLHRKMIESQNKLLSKRNEELVEVNEEKNNFIHILSHDLRAPINNITGLSKLLIMDGEGKFSEDQLRMIEHIASESRRLNKMVTRILDIEKIENKSPDEYHEIDLNKSLKRVFENYQTQAEEKQIQIETKLKPGIKVLGLDQYIFHVFENLVSNALKFSPMGKKIVIESVASEEWVEVRVIDEGPGMTEDDKKNMFKKFQVLSAKATGGERSTGLGLSSVNKYVNLLDGKLECDSVPGEGTTFTISLKIQKKKTSKKSRTKNKKD